jgi:DNA/RNA endonuclease YhcR with UshA esterase domain
MKEGDDGAPDRPGICQSCGRFVGPASTCEFCGADVQGRMALRLFKWACIPLALAGLVFLLLWARGHEVVRVRIGDITRTMNMGYVRLEGVAGDVRVKMNPQGVPEYISFPLDDGTGSVSIRINAAQSRILARENRIPRRGDAVSAEGPLRVGPEGDVSMYLPSARSLEVASGSLLVCGPGEVTADLVGRIIQIEGVVLCIIAPRPDSRAPYKVVLSDSDATVSLVLWEDVFQSAEKKGLAKGASVVARVTVSTHREKVQLRVDRASDMAVTPARFSGPKRRRETEETSVWDLGPAWTADLESVVRVRAEVVLRKRFAKGWRITVTDGSKSLPVVLFDDDFPDWAGLSALRPGALLEVEGTVKAFRGRREIVPAGPEAMKVTRPAPETAAPIRVETGKVKGLSVGRAVALKGKVLRTSPIRGGLKITLDDGSGAVNVILWDSVLSRLSTDVSLVSGATLTFRGKVGVYRGKHQIVVQDPGDVGMGE